MLWTAWLVGVALAAPSEALDAVVLVQQGATMCAGAVVDPRGTVVTAYHCVATGGHPSVIARDGRRAVARVVNVHVASDLAVLRVDGLAGVPFLSLRPESPDIGEQVHALGHPLGSEAPQGFYEGTLRWSMSTGVVAAVGARSLQITAPVNPGNSGGPVVDDEGRLVAVVSRRLAGDGLGFAGRVELVRSLLEEGERRWTPVGGTWGVEWLGSSYEGDGGVLSGGPRVEVVFRDRVVCTAGLALAPSARWDAVRFGRIRWTAGELRVGVRQRIGRGPWAGRVDGIGGLGWVQTVTGQRDLSTIATVTPTPLVGAALGLRAVAIDVAWHLPGGALRAGLVLRWPGPIGVF
ncbi:MAG: hypothetical protein ACI8PZ_006299 [Myxococcota bacterium]|jgi:hypothetical protein